MKAINFLTAIILPEVKEKFGKHHIYFYRKSELFCLTENDKNNSIKIKLYLINRH